MLHGVNQLYREPIHFRWAIPIRAVRARNRRIKEVIAVGPSQFSQQMVIEETRHFLRLACWTDIREFYRAASRDGQSFGAVTQRFAVLAKF